ncbi:TerB family tellurite resistance protein [Tianweitania sediminis]|uniref:TerB family tellurite resistance protein n=1 Tax=Tianweitania sediminis TaxID=1502156 RepID=A0A8J7UJQ5_9HYPH|nr:TerB family tellurite resistance protein [Tianweitania sediminis]MBP0437572.1 TerB family tellurite resistance protein [Tianweitania sediminis]
MFERLRSFLKGLPAKETTGLGADDPRVAVAALLIHVMDADGVRSEEERAAMKRALQESFGLEGGELESVVKAGEHAEQESVDFYAFTSVVNRELDEQQRLELIALMWQIVFADGSPHELEDNVVWRVAELIGVERRARMEMRIKASGRTPLLQDGDSQGN